MESVQETTDRRVEALQAYAAALTEIGPTLGKTADNPFFKSKYIPLPELLTEVRPILDKHGLVLTYPNGDSDGSFVRVQAMVLHVPTATMVATSTICLPCPTDAQKATAAVTYGRRTVTCSVLGIAEKDDDGNSTQGDARTVSSKPKARRF